MKKHHCSFNKFRTVIVSFTLLFFMQFFSSNQALAYYWGWQNISISGTVSTQDNGTFTAPIEGVTIILSQNGTQRVVTTDADGTFSFTAVFPGSYMLSPSKEGYTFSPSAKNLFVFFNSVSDQDFEGHMESSGGEEEPPQDNTDETYEDSAFGVFAAFAGNEFGYFRSQMGYSMNDYWTWAEDHMKDLGAHWTRSNLQFVWDVIEPHIGLGYDWNNAMFTDRIIKRIYNSENQVHFLGVFHSGAGPHNLRNPLDYQDEYKAFVRAAVERYDGDGIDDAAVGVTVKYWQAGNELSLWLDHGRTVLEYVQYLRIFREAVKEADPEAKIVLVSTDNGYTDRFMSQIINELAVDQAFDVIDIHHWGTALEWKVRHVPYFRGFLDSKGLTDVQIWSTENGTWQGQPLNEPLQTEQEQARSLIKRYVYNLNNGVDKLFWNNLMEWYHQERPDNKYNSMGLIIDGQGSGEDPSRFNTERIAYWAYKLLASKIDSHISDSLGQVQEVSSNGEAYVYAYQRKDNGKKLFILWSESGYQNVTFKADTSQPVTVTNMITDRFGNILVQQYAQPTNGYITILAGDDPLLFEE